MKIYIYNENCTLRGRSVPQAIIDACDDPAEDGDWTEFEAENDDAVHSLAADMLVSAKSAGAGTDLFLIRCAHTLLEAIMPRAEADLAIRTALKNPADSDEEDEEDAD